MTVEEKITEIQAQIRKEYATLNKLNIEKVNKTIIGLSFGYPDSGYYAHGLTTDGKTINALVIQEYSGSVFTEDLPINHDVWKRPLSTGEFRNKLQEMFKYFESQISTSLNEREENE